VNPAADLPVTQLIVKYEPGVAAKEAPGVATGDKSVAGVDLEPGRKMSLGLRTVELSEPLTQAEAQTAAAQLTADPRVEYAEPDYLAQPTTDVAPSSATNPNDTYYNPPNAFMWDLNETYGIDAPDAWAVTTGSSSVVVAVLDTGIRTHEDLDAAKQVPGYDMISNTLIANDGDTRDADPTDPGDGVTQGALDGGLSDLSPGCGVKDSTWHGMHVTGTINAASDNGLGIASVAPGVKVEPVRVLGRCGGFTSDIVDAIVWASGGTVSGVPANANPADVINMSLGSQQACTNSYQTAIDAAVTSGTTVVAAAGNSNIDVAGAAPASCNNVIAVGATGQDGKRANFSNYGAGIDVSAPGVFIASTTNAGAQGPTTDNYMLMSGTSQAAPHVAGLAALMSSRLPLLTPAQIETRIKTYVKAFPADTCDPVANKNHCGTGIANADAVTTGLVPGVPSAVTATPHDGSVDVAWTAPDDRGSTIIGYAVQAYVGPTLQSGRVCSTSSVAPTAATTNCTVSGLTNGTSYTFKVTATNSDGTSAAGTSSSAMPVGAPTTPTAPSGTPGNQSVSVSWVAPSSGGATITAYTVRTYQGAVPVVMPGVGCSTSSITPASAATSCSVSGLTNGTSYRFTVDATNSEGTSAESANSQPVTPQAPAIPPPVVEPPVTPTPQPTAPGVVGSLKAKYSKAKANLSWRAPANNGGAAVTGYRYRVSKNGGKTWVAWKSTGSTKASVTRKKKLRFAVQITAVNAAGPGVIAQVSLKKY
jgi:serine protease